MHIAFSHFYYLKPFFCPFVGGNTLTGAMPSEIGFLTNLVNLYLCKCQGLTYYFARVIYLSCFPTVAFSMKLS